MKILVMGAGLTGCTLARLLKDKGHDVAINEKMSHIGGLCFTTKSPNGILYEPYGAHTFHTEDKTVNKFLRRFSSFNTYVHNKGVVINGCLRHFPISFETIKKMPECNQILKELNKRPKKPNPNNFETYMISSFGKTLYKLFIYNYTKKMWGIEPKNLTPEWATKRIELRKTETEVFNGQWQGLPIEGYTKLFNKMIQGIPINYNNASFNKANNDLILFSGRIDELYNFKYGILAYRSLRYEYRENEDWENENYGTINLPQHPKFIRKVNFKILYQQKTNFSWIQYQEPISADSDNLPMYPIRTKKNLKIFDNYLKEACKSKKIIPMGRLGLYKYLDMDKAVALSFNMIDLIEKWRDKSPKARYDEINNIIAKY
jgi:UDP-galactopyranose mutase